MQRMLDEVAIGLEFSVFFELWIYLLLRILDAVTLTGHDKHHVPVI
jgi:hypothetical protein